MYFGFDKKFEMKKVLVDELQEIYGIGRGVAEKVCFKVGCSRRTLVEDINQNILKQIEVEVKKLGQETGVNLKREEYGVKKKEVQLKSYKGMRGLFGLPVNGQRTKTNSRTSRKSLNRV